MLLIAGLYVLQLPQPGSTAATWHPISANCMLATPDVLCYAPLDSSSNGSAAMEEDGAQHSSQLAGLLFIGSKTSSSQVMGWPKSDVESGAAWQQGKEQQQQRLVCPVLQSAFLPSLAGAQAAVALQEPTGVRGRATRLLATEWKKCA